jgi:CRISPR-associated protein Cas2
MDLSSRIVYIVAYDVRDPKRLAKVRKVLLGFGAAIQFSVFRCELTARELIALKRKLGDEIDHRADEVLFANLGPVKGRGADAVETIGSASGELKRGALVI